MGVRDTIAKALAGRIKVFHSSPHDFDRFDMSKLRTGQGANSYGPGVYLAENPKVSGLGGEYWHEFANKLHRQPASVLPDDERLALEYLINHKGDRAAALETLGIDVVGASPDSMYRHALRVLESGKPIGPRTYEVDIKAQPDEFLNWDRHLSEQSPQVRDALGYHDRGTRASDLAKLEAEVERIQKSLPQANADQPFDQFYSSLFAETPETKALGEAVLRRNALREEIARSADPSMNLTGKEFMQRRGGEAMDRLRDAGIPGVRYLDQGSRQAGSDLDAARRAYQQMSSGGRRDWGAWGEEVKRLEQVPLTYNYVVNDSDKLDIFKKYGIAGAGALPIGALAAPDQYEVQ